MDTQTSVKQLALGVHNAKVPHDDRCQIALASSWQRTTTRDKLSECRHERLWKINNQFNNQFPQFE